MYLDFVVHEGAIFIALNLPCSPRVFFIKFVHAATISATISASMWFQHWRHQQETVNLQFCVSCCSTMTATSSISIPEVYILHTELLLRDSRCCSLFAPCKLISSPSIHCNILLLVLLFGSASYHYVNVYISITSMRAVNLVWCNHALFNSTFSYFLFIYLTKGWHFCFQEKHWCLEYMNQLFYLAVKHFKWTVVLLLFVCINIEYARWHPSSLRISC